MPNNLIQIVRNSLTETNNNEIEQASSNPLDTKLNYQFMYKQLESAVEEILIKYPNDDVVKELRSTVIRNLQPILQLLKNNQE
jgi:ribosome maturation protein Sdo1